MKDTVKGSKHPNKPELLYGQEQYEKGYAVGYHKSQRDIRRRKETKERDLQKKFKKYVDYMEDTFASNRKR